MAAVTSALYHSPPPPSNGQAETMVNKLQQALESAVGDVKCRLARFLLQQNITVTTVTGITPAMLMVERELSTTLTHLYPREEQSDRAAAPRRDECTFQAK